MAETRPLSPNEASSSSLGGLVATLSVPFDVANPDHVAALRQLWELAWPGVAWEGVASARWRTLGFQRDDPVSDLRGAGVAGVRHLVDFIHAHPDAFREAAASHADHSIAIASLNLTLLLRAYLRLHAAGEAIQPVAPGGNLRGSEDVQRAFLAWEADSGRAFETIHGVFLCHMTRRWAALCSKPGTNLMHFPRVLCATRDLIGAVLPRLPKPWASVPAQAALRRAARFHDGAVPLWLHDLGAYAGGALRSLLLLECICRPAKKRSKHFGRRRRAEEFEAEPQLAPASPHSTASLPAAAPQPSASDLVPLPAAGDAGSSIVAGGAGGSADGSRLGALRHRPPAPPGPPPPGQPGPPPGPPPPAIGKGPAI